MYIKPDISVIIPIYNADAYLERCLSSVQKQTLRNIEILCINDGSTDESNNILQQYAVEDKRIKAIMQKNYGLSAARNRGLEAASGKYIFFLDSDDYLHPQTLEILHMAANISQAPVVIGETFCRLGKSVPNTKAYDVNKIKPNIYKNPLKNLYKKRRVSAVAWNKLYQADIIKNRRFIEGILYEDWPFTTCLFSDIKFFAGIKIPLYMYNTNININSITRSAWSIKKIKDYITGINFVYQYFSQPKKQAQWPLVQQHRIGLSLKMILSKISKSKENKNELEKFFKQEYVKLCNKKIISFKILTFKSKFRLLRLLWHQRKTSV